MVHTTDRRPQIDGTLSPGEWASAGIIDELRQVSPVEFSQPSQRSTFLVMFDSEYLYIAGHMHDTEPARIVAKTLRQGASVFNDDSISITIDPFNNKRSGYRFELNANSVREEAIYTSGTRLSDDWDGIWRGAGQIVDDGWTFEIAIPFKTVSFPPDNPTWGFNVTRRIPRNNELIAWTSRNGETNPTVAGELTGFRDMTQGKGLDVIPSVSATSVNDYLANESDTDFRPSLDISYKVTPAVNLVVTLNTDFAAAEVDERQLDLSRFSLFFPEKRTFFLTDFDIFEFGGISDNSGGGSGGRIPGAQSGTNGLPFFSRRIGLSEDREPVDLTGGVKLSGRIGDVDFGTLYVRQDEFEDIDAADLFIARVATGVLSESSVGAIATHGDPRSNETSSTIGVDFNYRNTEIGDNRTIEGWFWLQNTSSTGADGDDWAWSASIGMPTRQGWEWGGQVHEAQENYDPRLGFANRTGVRLYSGRVAHKWINESSSWFQRPDMSINYRRWEYLDTGQVQTERLAIVPFGTRTASGGQARLAVLELKERLLAGEDPLEDLGIFIPPGEYSFDRWDVFMRTAGHRPVSFEFFYGEGDYYNGQRTDVESEVELRVNKHLSFELEYSYSKYEFPGAEAVTRQMSFENVIAFNPNWSILMLAQYDNISDNIGIDMRLRYNRAAGQDFWLVLNHNMQQFDRDDPEYRSGGFRSVESVAALKLRYTFRF